MNVAFRVDASRRIGGGHLVRCLTLANALGQEGARVRFLMRGTDPHWAGEIRAAGHEVALLPPVPEKAAHAGTTPVWDDARMQEDHALCCGALGEGVDLLVVDHYGLDARWERAMRPRARRLLVVDDLANRDHDGDMLLDQNLLPDMDTRYRHRVPSSCRLLLGPSYTLLRPEFPTLRGSIKERDGAINRLLLFFGCGDAADMTRRALAEIQDLGLAADVVTGREYAHSESLARICERSGGRWALHVQTPRMAELMAGADVALGAGGTSHGERCCLGLPALVVTVADNQRETTRMLQERNACRWLGDAEGLPRGAFRDTLIALRRSPGAVARMSRAARSIIPPEGGTARVISCLKEEDWI